MKTKSDVLIQTTSCLTHDNDISHASEGGFLDFGDLVLVDAQLLHTLGHVAGNVLQHILGQVKPLKVGQRSKGLGVDNGDLVVDQDESLEEPRRNAFKLTVMFNWH